MTFGQFISKYEGKGIDVDGFPKNNPFQCMDLYRAYVKEVLSLRQSPPVVGAADVWDTYLSDEFDRVENTPSAVPTKGDIVIWGRKYGEFGHIAICTQANIDKLSCFSQNDPIGTLCRVREYSYKNILGWLHKKSGDTINPPVETISQDAKNALAILEVTRVNNNYGNLESTARAGQGAINDIPTLQKEKKNLQDEIDAMAIVSETQRKRVSTMGEKIGELTVKVDNLIDENSKLREDGLGSAYFTKRVSRFLFGLALKIEADGKIA